MKAVNVSVGLTLQDIIEVDDNSLTAIIWLNLEWVDEYLVWANKDYEVIIQTTIFQSEN